MACDLFGRLDAAVGELANFTGHDGKAAAVLARARRFDRGIERQQVCLFGDTIDYFDDVTDLLGIVAELTDIVG